VWLRNTSGDDFRARFGRWAVIAGGSDGIGEAFARELARRGLNVAAIARRREPLESVAAELRARHGVEARAIACDLTSAAGRGDDRVRVRAIST
jgi:short-subunit dehydrogenase